MVLIELAEDGSGGRAVEAMVMIKYANTFRRHFCAGKLISLPHAGWCLQLCDFLFPIGDYNIFMSFRLLLLFSTVLAAQTVERPVRAVTDPGVVTTRQMVTPAGVPTVFNGRVYGVGFRGANEIQVLTGVGVYRMDWRENKVLRHTAAKGRGGIQARRGTVRGCGSRRAGL